MLTPLAVGPGQPFPYISGLSLSLGVIVRDRETGEERFARVKVPEGLPRFVSVGLRGLLIPLENVIGHYLGWLFPEMEIVEQAAFRVTRDGDTEISDDADDLLVAVESELQKRRFGAVVRLEVSRSISNAMLKRLEERLPARPELVYPIQGLLDLADVMQLCDIDRPDLKASQWVPSTQRRLASPKDGSLFAEIALRDVVVQHPYDSFATSVESFVRAAAKDPKVVTLKTTVYRTSRDSALAPALIEAAEDGKQSVCVVELKARFDEQKNIDWARSLEQAGVHVVYGFPDMKIHAKTTLVVRREGDVLRRYVHIGTGNYHATTARIYEDLGLFTADPDITADVADLFNFVTGFGRPRAFRKILVAPFTLRKRLVENIRAVAEAAAAGKHARIRIKVNNLTDPAIVEELYRASQAGAEIDLIVRAICTLRPGVPGLSERIRVRSILGRFLEHSRLYCFEAGDEKTYLMGSADLMARNLDHRIEVVVPVEAAHVRARDRVDLQGAPRRQLPGVGAPRRRRRGNASSPRKASGGARPRPCSCAAASAPAGSRGPAERMWPRHHKAVPVGVIDVGSNTVRLLVARDGETLDQRRAVVGLGASIERDGGIPEPKLAEAADASPSSSRSRAREHVDRIEVLVTSPGRQATNGEELLDRLAAAAQVPVRLLSAEEEGRLAFVGAISKARGIESDDVVSVCDVGGGSAQVTVGTIARRRRLDAVDRHRLEAAREPLLPGRPSGPGGRARGTRAGRGLPRGIRRRRRPRSRSRSAAAPARSARSSARSSAPTSSSARSRCSRERRPTRSRCTYDLDPGRLSTLTAGAVILAALEERLDMPLRVGRGGLREGAVLELSARRAGRLAGVFERPLDALPGSGNLLRARARRRARSSSTIRPAAMPERAAASARTRSSATTASWWAPITSCRSRAARASRRSGLPVGWPASSAA